MADIQTRFTLRANAEGFDQARKQVSGLNDAMAKVAATQAKMGSTTGAKFGAGMGAGAAMGGGGGKRRGKVGDPMSVLLDGLVGKGDGRNMARDANSLINLIKRLENAQKHAGDVAVEGLRKEADAANKTADALNKRNKARDGGGGGGAGGGGGGGDGGDGGGGGGGRFGKYRKSFGLGVMQKVSGIDFLQSGMQGVAQMAGGAVGALASAAFSQIMGGIKAVAMSPHSVLTQGSGAITTMAQAVPFLGSTIAGGVQANVDAGQQELANIRSMQGLIPYLSRPGANQDQDKNLQNQRYSIAPDAFRYGGMNANEGFSALASSVAGSGGYLESLSPAQQRRMFSFNRLGIADLGTSASILRGEQLGNVEAGTAQAAGGPLSRSAGADILSRARNDADQLGFKGSEVQGYLRTVAEGIQSVVGTGIKFSQQGRSDLQRTIMINSPGMSPQRGQVLEEGFRNHLQQIVHGGIRSPVDSLVVKAAGYDPEKGAPSMAAAIKAMSREKNMPKILEGTLGLMRGVANSAGGTDQQDLFMMNLMEQGGLGGSPDEAHDFRTKSISAKRLKGILNRQRAAPMRTEDETNEQAAAMTPKSVLQTRHQENMAFRTGTTMAPDVQTLDARQAEFNRQLTGITEAFGDFNVAVADFVGRLTGLGAPVIQGQSRVLR